MVKWFDNVLKKSLTKTIVFFKKGLMVERMMQKVEGACFKEPSVRVNANSSNTNLTKIRYDLAKLLLRTKLSARLTTKFSSHRRRSLVV